MDRRTTIESQPRVLVAVVNNTRDFEIARTKGWYRIPLKRAPAQIGADYLAFYHTSAFEREKWSVRYYASVKGYRLVTRADLLPDEATHSRAGDKYYRIDIGPLQELPHPIPSRKLRRITFISTTLSRLLAAEDVHDLWERDRLDDKLWAAFREATLAAERRYQVSEERHTYEIEFTGTHQHDATVVFLDESHAAVVPNWFVSYFVPRHTCDDLPSCLDMVRQAMREHGSVFALHGYLASK